MSIVGSIALLITILFFIILFFAKSKQDATPANKSMLIDNQRLNNEDNRSLFNMMLSYLKTYSIPDLEQLNRFNNEIKNVLDDNDKVILETLHNILFDRAYDIGHGGTCDIMLNKGETFIYKAKSMSLHKVKTVSRTISGIGSRNSQNGLRLYLGTVSIYPNEQMVMVESLGTVYLTNKRILFISAKGKSYEIKLNTIVDYAIENNSVVITVNKGNPIKLTTNDNFHLWRDENNEPMLISDSTFRIANHIRKLKENVDE